LDSEHAKVGDLEEKIKALEEEMYSARVYIDELEEGAAVAVEEIEKLEREAQEAKATLDAMHLSEEQTTKTIEDLERVAQRNRELATQSKEALNEANRKLEDDNDHIADLEAKIMSLERERDKLHKQIDDSMDPSWKPAQPAAIDEEIEILERELDDAHKEIGRLNALLSQSPARKAVDKVKDARIEMLEQEREELLERNKALRMTFNEMATPNKRANSSMISPIHRHVLSMSIKAPRTPGAPLKDVSDLRFLCERKSLTKIDSSHG
jgi:chromosome segregation ATPase